MKNKKFFYAIMIAIIVIGSFLSTVTPSSAQEVIITTDKTEYEQGEEINATLNYQGEIYQWGNCGWSVQMLENDPWVTIQKRGDLYFRCVNIPECKDVNLNKTGECLSAVLCERPIWYKVQEMPKDIQRFTWDQSYKIEEKTFQCNFIQHLPDGTVTSKEIKNSSCAVFEQVPPGQYKIRFEYASAINPDDPFDRNIDIKYAEKEFMIQKSHGKKISRDITETKCRYAEFLSLGKNYVIFNAPFVGIKNDKINTYKTELYTEDFIRFPETVEVGEIIKVLNIAEDYALIEYTYYSAPPAPEKHERYKFKIYR